MAATSRSDDCLSRKVRRAHHAEKYTDKSSNFLVKERGRWRAVASHVSGYEQRE